MSGGFSVIQRVGVLQTLKLGFAAQRPAAAHLHALAGFVFGGEVAVGLVGRAFVELHDDVTVERGLNLHAHFGRHEEFVPVDGRGKGDPLFGDLAHGTERPNLKTTAVGEDGFVPLLKSVQAAKCRHGVQARAHPQVKRVAQNDLRAHVVQTAWHHPFDRAIRAHRHEDGCLHHAVVQGQAATASQAFGFQEFESQHRGSLRF